MKIIVNDIAADKFSGGAFTVLEEFYRAIRLYGTEHEWVLLLADNYFEETANITIKSFPKIKKSWLKRLEFDFFSGKKLLSEFDADLYFSLQNTALFGTKVKQVVYLHQPLPYQKEKNFSFFKRDEWKLAVYQKIVGRLFNLSLTKADKIIVQTNWMKQAVTNALHHKSDIFVIPPGLTINLEDIPSTKVDMSQFFYPSAGYVYKNHQILFSASTELEQKGIHNYQIRCTLDPQTKQQYGDNERIQFVGKRSLEEVYQSYQRQVLIFPSYIETFGLPLLEAKMFNTVILASDTSFSREILAGYPNAYFFDYRKPSELADLIIKCLNGQIKQHPPATHLVTHERTDSSNSWQQVISLLVD